LDPAIFNVAFELGQFLPRSRDYTGTSDRFAHQAAGALQK
jgi:hypothetical protein